MYFYRRLKSIVASLVLRRWVADWWIQRKTKRLEKRFCGELVAASEKPRPTLSIRPIKTKAPLRQLLFIGDIMWEANDLIPELEKICPVLTLDLNPHLKKKSRW